MRNLLSNYFYYSRGERNGVAVLASLSLVIMMMPHLISRMQTYRSGKTDLSLFEKDILAFHNAMPSNNDNMPYGQANTEGYANGQNNIELFRFDPNSTLKEDFIRLGLSPKVATTIIHYREKGGHFYRKEDLKKIYGLNPNDYDRLESYITLSNDPKSSLTSFTYMPSQRNNFDAKNEQPVDIKVFPFDPNTATDVDLLTLGIDKNIVKNILKFREKNGRFYKKEDLKRMYGFSEIDFLRLEKYININDNQQFTNNKNIVSEIADSKKPNTGKTNRPVDVNKANVAEWLELRGIGSTFAARIVEQREKLGGFASIEQIKNIHGLHDSTYRNILPYLTLSTPIYRKISINKITIENGTHPYLTRKQVEVLSRYRLNHGEFKKIEDLKNTGIFSADMLEQLKPYLSFD